MATTLGQLRQFAKSLDIPVGDIRGASSEELQALISEKLNGGGTKAPARKTRTAPARKTTVARKTAASAKSKPAAKSTTGKAKRSTSGTGNGSGRHLLVDVDYNQTENWNAREGSAPDLIVKALRRFKGNRAKVFDALVPKIGTFVNPKDSQGRKRSKENAEEMLRYRISRTAWDFAMKTGQHEKSTDRVEYGSNATQKTARKATGSSRTSTKTRTAPRATRKTATRQKAAQRPAARKTATKKSPVAKKKTTARR